MLLSPSILLAIVSIVRANPLQTVLRDAKSKSHTLNFTASSPHIFSSLRSLLQQWPNVIFPNGHSVVPCEIRPYTTLYHGRRDSDLPASPEWFAFDAEMSYGIMGSTRNSHMLTYQTVQPVKCLYFDGMSAALMGTGQLDSQMTFLYGNTSGPPQDGGWRGLQDEYDRATGLCNWAEANGVGGPGAVEAIVRMNAGFELIWCDFNSPSIQLVSKLNVTAPLLPEGYWDDETNADGYTTLSGVEERAQRNIPTTNSLLPLPTSTKNSGHSTPDPLPAIPPNWRNQMELEPFLRSQSREWYRSATWHPGISGLGFGVGEGRVTVLTCGFASFYDPIFHGLLSNTSAIEKEFLNLTVKGEWKGPGAGAERPLALQQLTRRKRSHTLANITPEEAASMTTVVLNSLQALSDNSCSGVDWSLVASDISSRYSLRLSEFVLLLSSNLERTGNDTKMKELMASARAKAHNMLMPFLEYPPESFQHGSKKAKSNWTLDSDVGQRTLGRCQYAYTRLLYNSSGFLPSHIKPQEITIIDAVEDVLSSICSTVISVGFEIEQIWLDHFNCPNTTSGSHNLPNLGRVISRWRSYLEELIAWLGWAGDSVRCDRLCAPDEFCYLPAWPLTSLGRRDGGHFPRKPPSPPKKGGPGPPPPKNGDPGKPPRPRPRDDMFDEELWSPRCVKWDG